MKSEKVFIENQRGQRLAALFDRPVDGRPIAVALFAHCFTCSKNLKAVNNISRALTAEGIAVLRFDFTGLGESEGEFAETSFSTNVADLVAAASFLEERSEAPAVLIGHSLGGTAALMAAADIPSVRAVATIAAPSSPRHIERLVSSRRQEIERDGEAVVEIAGRPFTITKQFLDDLGERSMLSAIEGLERALLILHSPVDTVVSIDNATEIFLAAKHPKSFVSLDTADHLLEEPTEARFVGSLIAAWSRRYIGAPQEERKLPAPGDDRVIARTEATGYRTEILANGHPLVADEPLSVGGSNTGPSPYELLSAALGACTTMTLRMYADRKGWSLESAETRISHRKVHCEDCENPDSPRSRIDHFERELLLEGELEESQRERLLQIADRCPVHRTLHSDVRVTTTLVETDG